MYEIIKVNKDGTTKSMQLMCRNEVSAAELCKRWNEAAVRSNEEYTYNYKLTTPCSTTEEEQYR